MDNISKITEEDIVHNKYTKHSNMITDPDQIELFYDTAITREENSSAELQLQIWSNYFNWAKKIEDEHKILKILKSITYKLRNREEIYNSK